MKHFIKSRINFAIPVVAKNRSEIENQINIINTYKNISTIEIRLDYLEEEITDDLLKLVREKTEKRLIATYRCDLDSGKLKSYSTLRREYLLKAITNGFNIADIEFNRLRKTQISEFIEKVKTINKKAEIIISYHDFKKNLKYGKVKQIIKQIKLLKPNLIKIAFRIDNRPNLKNFVRMLFDFKRQSKIPISLIGLGKYSGLCRILAYYFKQNLIFLSLNEDLKSAPGQISYEKYFQIINELTR
ncbi:MAG TPA: type I 3-dehydroquinate dehydratase [bacterium]|nr:type I 3-dehydroquinate dehydratase [bacterium]HOL46735.1 type I 3-dehydroquinate dehydratase [bacterium]HPQ18171.1 type I 3-dehydroquinate dehydratase [bacterium]